MAVARRLHHWLWIVMLAGGCDPLVDDGYFGAPVFEIDGRIVDVRFPDASDETPTASIAWSTTGEPALDPAELVRQSSVAVALEFPSTFKLRLFELPPVLRRSHTNFEVGHIIVWHDGNGNDVYERSELRGASGDDVILYSEGGMPAAESPTGLNLPPGFTVAQTPLPCVEQFPLDAEDCGVPLGDACQSDSDCGTRGRCLTSDGYVAFPDGYCVMPLDVPCVPTGGGIVLLANGEVWGRACTAGDDCARDEYACLFWSGTCEPISPVALVLDADPIIRPLCQQLDEPSDDPGPPPPVVRPL